MVVVSFDNIFFPNLGNMKKFVIFHRATNYVLKTDINNEKEAGESINKNLDHKVELDLAKPFKRSYRSKTCDNFLTNLNQCTMLLKKI